MSLVVFDMDGTLIDSGAEITARVLKAFASVGLPAPSRETIRANVGLSLPIYLGAVSGSEDPEVISALFDAYRAAAAASPPGQMPMFDGARGLLERLKNTARYAIGGCDREGTGRPRKDADAERHGVLFR